MASRELEIGTRAIYDKIHVEQASHPQILKRLRQLITTESLGLAANYFENKIVADLGCGSAVPGAMNLLDLGARFVHAMDVNDTFLAPATRILSREPAFQGRWQLDIGTLAGLPYEDGFFDFVLCQGVIHSVDDDRKALSEICRVLKLGGTANIMVLGSGGLMTRIGMETMRDEYRCNPFFRALVDRDLTTDWIEGQIDWLIAQMDDDGSPSYQKCVILLECLRELLDQDFILTLRDRMQTPKYKTYSFQEATELLRDAGFSSWRRIARKPVYQNVRKILAPLYHRYDSPLARLMYGEGGLIFIAIK
jgi:SAM-dependent methyltransferase